ncbi:MAG: VCBS repeat-containing protein [Candidatus Altiarchaeota archaeon]
MKYVTALLLVCLATTASSFSDEYMQSMWNYTAKEVISGLDVADLDGNGVYEILVATSQEGAVYSLNNRGTEYWSKPYRMSGYVFELSAADLNSDGRSEVIAGYGSHAIGISESGSELWKYSTSLKHVQVIDHADLNGDGKNDVVVSTYKKDECKSATIYAIDASTYPPNTIWKHTLSGDDLPVAIDAGDLNGDGKADVVVGLIYRAKVTYKSSCNPNIDLPSKIIALSNTGEVMWESGTAGGVTWVKIADINGDGDNNVIVSSKPYVYALSKDGAHIWQTDVNDAAGAGIVEDLDGDGEAEIGLALSDLKVLDSKGKSKWVGLTGSRVYSIDAGDLDNDGYPEIVVGSNKVYVFDRDGKPKWESAYLTTVDYVHARDMDADNYGEIVAGAVKNVYYFKTQEYAKKLRADELFSKAMAYKSQKNIELSIECLEDSKSLYSQLGLMDRVSDCINELDGLNSIGEQVESLKREADSALNLSKHAYINQDYESAIRNASIARSKYASPQLNDRLAIDECDRRINESGAVLRLNASIIYNKSLSEYKEKNYESALMNAKKAESLYRLAGDRENADEAALLVENITIAAGVGDDANKVDEGGNRLGMPSFMKYISLSYVLGVIILISMIGVLTAISIIAWQRLKMPRLKLDKPRNRAYAQSKVDGTGRKHTPTEKKHTPLDNKHTPRRRAYAPAEKKTDTTVRRKVVEDRKPTPPPAEKEPPAEEKPRNKGIIKTTRRRLGHNLTYTGYRK